MYSKDFEENKDDICFTDIKDVFFNKSPNNINVNFYIGADCFQQIENHGWNRESIVQGFPEVYDTVKTKYPLCAGVIIGKGTLLQEFFREVFEVGMKSNYRDLINWCAVDQAAVNILAHTTYSSELQYPKINDRIVLNMANLKSLNNIENYTIYHQYDRHKEFANLFVNKK